MSSGVELPPGSEPQRVSPPPKKAKNNHEKLAFITEGFSKLTFESSKSVTTNALLYKSIREAKLELRNLTYNALLEGARVGLKKVVLSTEKVLPTHSAQALKNYFVQGFPQPQDCSTYFPLKLATQLVVLCKANGIEEDQVNAWRIAKEIIQKGSAISRDELKEILGQELSTLAEEFEKNIHSSFKEYQFTQTHHFQKEYNKLCSEVCKIAHNLSLELENIKDPKKNIAAVIKSLRACESNAAYQFLRENEAHPVIQYLHIIALVAFTQPVHLTAYSKFGDHLAEVTSKGLEKETPTTFRLPNEKPLPKLLRKARDFGYKLGLIKDDLTLEYVIKHPSKSLSAFSSHWLGKKILGYLRPYDPNLDQENHQGAAYDEAYRFDNGEKVDSRRIYAATPTIGDTVSGEAKLFLQAMQNRHFFSKEELKKDPYPFLVWNCTNLQNITTSEEGSRSVAIMELAQQFPLSFYGISLTLDSDFYKAGVRGHNEKKITEQILENGKEPFNENYQKKMYNEIINPKNFTLEKRKKAENKGGGNYFPLRTEAERNQFSNDCEWLIQLAFDAIPPSESLTGQELYAFQWYQKAAFRELVTMGLIKYFEAKSAQKLASEQKENPQMVTSAQCKECIDRGGRIDAAFIWGSTSDSKENEKLAFTAFHARALLCRSRLILPDRAEPFYALTQMCDQGQVNKFLKDVARMATGQAQDTVSDATPVLANLATS